MSCERKLDKMKEDLCLLIHNRDYIPSEKKYSQKTKQYAMDVNLNGDVSKAFNSSLLRAVKGNINTSVPLQRDWA